MTTGARQAQERVLVVMQDGEWNHFAIVRLQHKRKPTSLKMLRKLVVALAIAAISATGVSAQEDSAIPDIVEDMPQVVADGKPSTPPVTTVAPPKPACQHLDFKAHQADFGSMNTLIDAANLMAKGMLGKFDPFTVKDKALDMIPFKSLLSEFQVKPTIQTMTVSGVKNVFLHHLNNLEPTQVSLGLQFNGELHVRGAVNINVVQVNRKWYNICWTDFWHPARCNPLDATMEFEFGVINPSGDVVVNADMMECPKGVPASVCSNLTPSDIIGAALSQKFDELLKRIFLRINSASIQQVTAKFDQITAADAHFTTDCTLLRQIQAALQKFSIDALNKHDFIYETFMKFVQDVTKLLSNIGINKFLAPKFGGTCYEK